MQKYTSVQLEAKTALSNRCPRAQVEMCMHHQYHILKNVSRINDDYNKGYN